MSSGAEIYNIGSINIDTIFRVPHLPNSGETLAARSVTRQLGGKGANQSIAIARAGGSVFHLGAVGNDVGDILQEMERAGVHIGGVQHVADVMTGQAIIAVDDVGENTILLDTGANVALNVATISGALAEVDKGSTVVMQNETNGIVELARTAKSLGHRVVWSAAPFDAEVAIAVVPFADMIALNRNEYDALLASSIDPSDLGRIDMLVTDGSRGAGYKTAEGNLIHVDAVVAKPVDTTGAGDTFLGTFLAERQKCQDIKPALERASLTAALHVTRAGTASAIPTAKEVDSWSSS